MEKAIQFSRDEQKAIVRGLYDMRNAMLMDGTLNAHLEEIDRRTEEMLDRLVAKRASACSISNPVDY